MKFHNLFNPSAPGNSKIGLDWFLNGGRASRHGLNYVSLFSGGGVGDVGFVRSGWTCIAACERDELRTATFKANVKGTSVFGDIKESFSSLIEYCENNYPDLDMVVATPPCQSFSTANAKRGDHADAEVAAKDARNSLFFYAISVVQRLQPKVAIFENVPNFFTRKVRSLDGAHIAKIGEFLDASLPNYHGYQTVMCFSAFGVPQRRRRALAIYVRKDIFDGGTAWRRGEHPMLPPSWPDNFREKPLNAKEALSRFASLDGRERTLAESADDPLHRVPSYDPIRYRWIADIPPDSGRSAYENDNCPSCGASGIEAWIAFCPACRSPLANRPHVFDETGFRLIKGFKTSYRRMRPDVPASTITTASSHFGSDIKLHPSQNRVLSMRECSFLQTIPADFDWSPPLLAKRKKTYALRQIIGEAVPSWFTFKLGSAVATILLESSQKDLTLDKTRLICTG